MVGTFNKSVSWNGQLLGSYPWNLVVALYLIEMAGNGEHVQFFPKKTIQQSSSFWEDFTTWPCREAPAGSKASTEKAQYCCSTLPWRWDSPGLFKWNKWWMLTYVNHPILGAIPPSCPMENMLCFMVNFIRSRRKMEDLPEKNQPLWG